MSKTFDLGPVTAYAIAVENGYKGTKEEWLASLVGATPNITVGAVETLAAECEAAAAMEGTAEHPVLNLSLPRGKNGHAADWQQSDPTQSDYVKNRTHWVEEIAKVEILPETQGIYDDSEGMFTLETTPVLVVGETYVVNWNGVEYTCTAKDGSAISEEGTVVLGDVYTASGGQAGTASTGEPFFVGVLTTGCIIFPLDGATSLTISIYQGGRKVHKLNNEFLNLEWLPVYKEELLAAEKTVTNRSTEAITDTVGGFPDLNSSMVSVGQRLVVYFDGGRYEVSVVEDEEMGILSDNYVAYLTGDTTTPFYLTFLDGRTNVNCATGEHVASVYAYVPNKLPAEFLPDEAVRNGGAEIILTSPSGARFSITVSDDGTLAATEVTE